MLMQFFPFALDSVRPISMGGQQAERKNRSNKGKLRQKAP